MRSSIHLQATKRFELSRSRRQLAAVVALGGLLMLPGRSGTAQTSSTAGSPVVPQAAQGAQTTMLPGAQTGVLPPGQSGLQPGRAPAPAGPPLPLSPGNGPVLVNPIRTPTISPGELTLLEEDGRLSQAVAAGGGAAFATWFADDAVTLNNGRPAVRGRGNIAGEATWAAADYQLTWTPQGAQMGPSNDMGFTWGTYQGRSKDKAGEIVTTTGRYITVWRKQRDGQWKIAMEASANEAPAAGDCCTLPKP